MKTILVSAISLLSLDGAAQTLQNFPFQNYPAKVTSAKKAPVNLASHRLGRLFKTAITKSYSQGKVNFGGHYITALWGAGTGQTEGAMVDVLTGKLYELPLNEDNSNRGVYHDGNNNIAYKRDSNAFVCYMSSAHAGDEGLVDLTYYYYKWNDLSKKFELLKTKSVTTKLIDE